MTALAPATTITAAQAGTAIARLLTNMSSAIVADRARLRLAVVCLLSGGHVLLEDVPGVGKTLLAKTLARSIQADFKRIQFTPDLLPSDITGGSIYNPKTGEFSFSAGPLFSHIVLADEINRATPRTQSALLEAMGEASISLEGTTRHLPAPFFVIATQNPVESYGTFPLPEAQLDRFTITLSIGYPGFAAELTILEREEHVDPLAALRPVLALEHVVMLQQAARAVEVARPLKEYLLRIVTATRENPDVTLGASPRSAVAFQRAAQAFALSEGRNFVLPDDIKALAAPVLAHRLITRSRKNSPATDIIAAILATLPVPAM